VEDAQAVKSLRMKAGCFVLLTNLSEPEFISQWLAKELLRSYKSQSGIEQNFEFFKDPVIVNSIFLKTPHRIEALGPRADCSFNLEAHGTLPEAGYPANWSHDYRLEVQTDEKAKSFYDDYKIYSFSLSEIRWG
jgi:hypothetical protein